ncbi:MAG: rhomboid family intramembrane serine protease [Bacteroidota bacterium]
MLDRMTDVVKNLLIINVLVFIVTGLLYPNWMNVVALHHPYSPYFQPFQIITHFFAHGGIGHIFFNMFGLVLFGSALEALWGAKRFLFYYIFSALGAAAVQTTINHYTGNFDGGMLGASGALYGLLLAFAIKFPNVELMLLFLPVPIKAKYFVPILIGIDLVLGFSNFGTGIAHFAHVGGALFGLILILIWNRFYPEYGR